MKAALLLFLLGVFFSPLAAEDWTTTDGKTYKDVKVVSHGDAYVTILDDSGGGRILIATLSPDLQKRFGYDPVKAAAEIAKVAAQEERDKEALARERQASQAGAQQGQEAIDAAVAQASLPPPPDTNSVSNAAPPPDAATTGDVANEGPAYGTTEIDSYPYGYYGGYFPYPYGYVPYGYGVYSNGYRGFGHRTGTGEYTHVHPQRPTTTGTTTRTFTTGGAAGSATRGLTTGTTPAGTTAGTAAGNHH